MDIYKLILIYQFLSYIQSQIIPLNYSLSVNDFAVIVLISEPHEYKHFYIDMVTNFTWATSFSLLAWSSRIFDKICLSTSRPILSAS